MFKRIDMHRKSCQDLERLIDRLSQTNLIVIIITGKGTGVLRSKLMSLSRVYGFRLVIPTDNGSEYTCDFAS